MNGNLNMSENHIDVKHNLIENILNIELDMFLTVQTLEKASCQEHPDEFRKTRNAQFLTWSEKTLTSYLNDLKTAREEGRNLMTLKYALMDNMIPRQNIDPLIQKIVDIQCSWQKEVMEKFPNLMGRSRPLRSSSDTDYQTSFETYLRGELETYSQKTLTLLNEDISAALLEKKNMNQKLYEYMVKNLGFESLEEAEETIKNK